jgi:DNA mismatch endonuclease (patch repair protein)
VKKIEKNRKRDDEINKELFFKGWTVVRFWGKDIKNKLDECVNVIEDIIWEQKMEEAENEEADRL